MWEGCRQGEKTKQTKRVSKELPAASSQHCPPRGASSAWEELCGAGGAQGVPAHTRRVLQEGMESQGQRRPLGLRCRAVPKLGRGPRVSSAWLAG